MNRWIFHDFQSLFQSYKSKRSSSFANLICSKTCLRFAILSHREKLWNVFEIVLEKCEVFVQKIRALVEIKIFADRCLGVSLPTVKIWGQSDKFPMSFSFLQCPLRVKKNWFQKTALNMSIRRVIFTSGQNLKPPFLCQYLIFFNDFFFYIRDFIWIITLTEKSKFEGNYRSEGIL